MDLGFIDMCMKSYNGKLGEDDDRRLRFFRGLWEVMANAIDERTDKAPYTVPPIEQLEELYASETPIFKVAPVSIDADDFANTADAITDYLKNSGNYEAQLIDELSSLDWKVIFEAAQDGTDPGNRPIAQANNASTDEQHAQADDASADEQDPQVAVTSADGQDVQVAIPSPGDLLDEIYDELDESISDTQAKQLGFHIATLTLYTFLESPSKAIMDNIGYNNVIDTHPLLCPVCGSEPMLASVGAKTSSAGRGRLLYCLDCGASWEFDRIRCAHCGTHDQTKLHYVSIEGDDDHRLGFCDECGGFMRTTFMDSSLFPISPLVEDVVMAPLSAIGAEEIQTSREQ